MKQFFLMLLVSAGTYSMAVPGDDGHHSEVAGMYSELDAKALLSEISLECAERITTSSASSLLKEPESYALAQEQLLIGCSSFNGTHEYAPCRTIEAFIKLLKPSINSLMTTTDKTKQLLYLAAFQEICHNQPVIFPKGNIPAMRLYRKFQNIISYYSSVANQPAWVVYTAVGIILSISVFLLCLGS